MTPEQPQAKAARRTWLATSLAASGAFILVQILRWPLVSVLTVFLEPFLEIAVFLCFAVVGICCLVYAIRNRRSGSHKVWLPVAICLAAGIIVATVPFNQLYLKANFHLYRSRRTAVAETLLRSESGHAVSSGARGDLITLDGADSQLSEDGQVVIDRRDGKAFVLFFTF